MDDADITWRRAGAADVPAIRTLSRAAYAKWVELIGREPKPMTADYDAAVRAHRIDLLFSGGMLAGLVQTSREPDHLLIVSVAVLPACQGQGFGRRLLQHAEEAESTARKNGGNRITRYDPMASTLRPPNFAERQAGLNPAQPPAGTQAPARSKVEPG